jgi:hypothetical protein
MMKVIAKSQMIISGPKSAIDKSTNSPLTLQLYITNYTIVEAKYDGNH